MAEPSKRVHVTHSFDDPSCLQTLELDPGNTVAVAKTARLEPVVAERREKMKDEMIGAAADDAVFIFSVPQSRLQTQLQQFAYRLHLKVGGESAAGLQQQAI